MSDNRIELFDRSKVFASQFNVLLHVLVPFMITRTGMWPLKYQNGTNQIPDTIIFIIHLFNMPMFFLMAGFFALFLFNKLGMKGFIYNRWRKIALPFLIAWFVLIPIVIFYFPIGNSIEYKWNGWEWSNWLHEWIKLFKTNHLLIGHLWFIDYLLFYYFIFIAINRIPSLNKWILLALPKIHPLTIAGISILLLSLCTYTAKDNLIRNPLTATPETSSFLYYFICFCWGWWLYYHIKTPSRIWNRRWLLTIAAIAFALPTGVMLGLQNIQHEKDIVWMPLSISIGSAIAVIFATAAFYAWMNNPNQKPKFPKWVINSTFWVYLVHLPLLMPVHLILFSLQIHLFFKLIISIVVPYLMALYSYKLFGWKLLGHSK
jgi:glucans biosynthesis protein C